MASYRYRSEGGAVDTAKLKACRREAERDPKLTEPERTEWLARFDAVEAGAFSKFPPTMKIAEAGDDVSIDMLGDIGPGFWDEGITAQQIAGALKGKAGTVKIRMNSGGGDAMEGAAIANILSASPNRVEVDVVGLAASAATLVTAAADEVRMGDGSLMMVHGASTIAAGDARRLKSRLQLLEAIDSQAAETYARRTGKPVEEMRALMAAETWMTAQQAVDAGFADRVVAGESVQMAVDPELIPADLIKKSAPPKRKKGHASMKAIATRLGLSEDASETEILSALEEQLTADESEDPEKKMAEEPASKPVPTDEPEKKPEKVEEPKPDPAIAAAEKLFEASVLSAVERAITDTKVEPANRTLAIAACGDTPAQLARQIALWDASPALKRTKATSLGKVPEASSLTPQQMKLAKLANLTPEQWLAARNETRMEHVDA